MKISLIHFGLLLLLLPFKSIGQDKNNATLDETISWIEGKLNFTDNSLTGRTRNDVIFDKITNTLKYTRIYLNPDFSVNQYYITYIPMKNANPANIKISQNDGRYWVYLYSNDSKPIFKVESWFANEASNKLVMLYPETYITFSSNELEKTPNLPERLKIAFIHLIKLCGGTGEKF